MRIVLDRVPPSMNRFAGRENSREYREQKKAWSNWVQLLCCKVRPAVPFEKSLVSITYRFPDKRRRDPDNYSGKLLLDGLTRGRVIADDSFSHIELRVRAEPEPGEPRTIIEVEEMK